MNHEQGNEGDGAPSGGPTRAGESSQCSGRPVPTPNRDLRVRPPTEGGPRRRNREWRRAPYLYRGGLLMSSVVAIHGHQLPEEEPAKAEQSTFRHALESRVVVTRLVAPR